MPITELQLLLVLPKARTVAGIFLPALNRAMARFKINSRLRAAAFLAQVGHESGQLRNLVENLNYSADTLARTWPTRFTALSSAAYGRQPEKIANKVADRMANGPESSGDGWRYRGRGLIQLTGQSNYRAAADGLGLPLIDKPELLEQPEYACQSAAWWWAQNGLNELAGAGKLEAITRKINGGLHGQADRLALYERALKVLVRSAGVPSAQQCALPWCLRRIGLPINTAETRWAPSGRPDGLRAMPATSRPGLWLRLQSEPRSRPTNNKGDSGWTENH